MEGICSVWVGHLCFLIVYLWKLDSYPSTEMGDRAPIFFSDYISKDGSQDLKENIPDL